MVQEIKIRCKNNKKTLQLPIGSTLWDAYHALNLQMPYGPVSAKVNNKVEGLHYRFYNDKDVELSLIHIFRTKLQWARIGYCIIMMGLLIFCVYVSCSGGFWTADED